MNRGEILEAAELWLNANPDQANQDFTREQLEKLLNVVYREEVNKAKLEGLSQWFRKVRDVTWPANEARLELPAGVSKLTIKRIVDVTDDDMNNWRMTFTQEGFAGQLFWYDNNTLEWAISSNGPSDERTLRIFYLANAEPLANDNDAPELIPPEHHDLLALSVAIKARKMAEDSSPREWLEEQRELRFDLYKALSKGKPLDDVPWMEPHEDDSALDYSDYFL